MGDPIGTRTNGPKACSTCAKAKARCVPCADPSILKCERCDRLNKTCSKRMAAPPRPRKKEKASRVALLEKRLDDLSSQLAASNEQERPKECTKRRPWHTPYTAFSHIFVPSGEADDRSSDLQNATPESSRDEWTDTNSSTQMGSPSDSPAITATNAWPTGAEAQTFLENYRTCVMPLFPFVVVPPGLSSEELRSERPFMWKSIMLQSCGLYSTRQVKLGRELLRDLTEALLIRPAKSLDVLQGLLLFLTWFHSGLSSYQITNLVGLAKSICLSFVFKASQSIGCHFINQPDALEQLRAYLGTYYLTSAVFTTSKRVDAFMDTSYLECLIEMVEKGAYCPTDKNMVQLIRIQELAQSIVRALTVNFRNIQTPQFSSVPLIMIVKNFQAQVNEFKNSVPDDLRDNVHIQGHIYVTEILLYEVGLQDMNASFGNLQPTERLGIIWSLFGSLKSFLALRFNHDARGVPALPCICSIDIMYAFITCLKLISFQAPGCDIASIRQDPGLIELLEHQIQDLDQLAARRHTLQKVAQDGKAVRRLERDPALLLLEGLKGITASLRAATPKLPPPDTAPVTQVLTPPSFEAALINEGDSSKESMQYWEFLLESEQAGSSWDFDPTRFPYRIIPESPK